ncbi:MAG: succinyl-CoA synthetase beta subunit [Bacillota bacterium]|jgi:succinyl-CoA synthetase beta subunit|nr:succinyl-CoA synthetase beta subunit [Bacillota bacterium]MDK2960612.1 succinyl-CoA synthetase beta subunit [Bacillota bacterium]
MRLYEYMGKDLFRTYGIPVPQGVVATSPAAAELAGMKPPVVLKAQILSGKRGKGGGILFAATPQEIKVAAERLFTAPINGYSVNRVLIEERLDIARELYLAITVNRSLQAPVILASAQGGMDIEEVPAEAILTRPLEVAIGLPSYVAREVASFLALPSDLRPEFAALLQNLYRLFREKDAELVEINPLVITAAGQLVAADAKVIIDDDALFRHPELVRVEEVSEAEAKARQYDLAYVELDGNIGVLANGAGITMATLDTLQYYGGRARNFLDIGGGASVEKVAAALEIIFASRPKALFINIFGGITRCDDVATALVEVKKRHGLPVPVVIRMVGTNEEEGVRILRANGLEAYTRMEEAAQKVVEIAESAA